MSFSPLAAVAMMGLACLHSNAQPASRLASFDVTSIKPVTTERNSSSTNIDHGSLTAYNISIRRLIQAAFDVRDYQILDTPGWADEARYDVLAKSESGSGLTEKQTVPMIQTLLSDRFQLRFHKETREISGYALVLASGGPKIPLAAPDAAPRTSITNFTSGRVSIEAAKITLPRLTQVLESLLKQPVVDRTGLFGSYVVKLEYDSGLSPDSTVPSLFSAIQEFGLRLQAGKVPVEMIVVESVSQPSAN